MPAAPGAVIGSPLPRAFFARDAETVARALLGTVLVRVHADGRVQRVRLVETEAYVGAHDLACHASKGRTGRTEVMFGTAGHAYVYLIYGMYDMLNLVTGEVDDPQAVLIRGAEPLEGVAGALNGPGRLCRSLGITRALNGADVCGEDHSPSRPGPAAGLLRIEAGEPVDPQAIVVGPRIGVETAGEWTAAPLRFYVAGSPFVSRR